MIFPPYRVVPISSVLRATASAPMDDNWHLEVKFQGQLISLIGRLPAEKRTLTRDFPKKLAISTRAKLSAIPHKGFFCKFMSKHVEELKGYMKKNECAVCVHFIASTCNFTLYLIPPASMKRLQCLQRLKKCGVPSDSIQSLCTERHGVVIGFIVSETNPELEEKLVQRQQALDELTIQAKQMSNQFGDPMLEFDMMIEEVETKPSVIPVCTRFILQHPDLYQRIIQKIRDMVIHSITDKGKLNMLYLVHDIVKSIRATCPKEELKVRNAKMKESSLILLLETILYDLYDQIPNDMKQMTNVRAVFDFWKKWELQYDVPPCVDEMINGTVVDPVMVKLDETFALMEQEKAGNTDEISKSSLISSHVVDFIQKHHIVQGPWEIYLSRAPLQDLEELDKVMCLNEEYLEYNRWEGELVGRKTGEAFLLDYIKIHMPELVKLTYIPPSHETLKRKRSKSTIELLRDAFLSTWDVDNAAQRAISDVEMDVMDDVWRKMENEKCVNPSAFVFGKIRRMKTIQFASIPELDLVLEMISNPTQVDKAILMDTLVRVFQLDSMATTGLSQVSNPNEVCRIIQELCERCRERMVANPSVHVVKLCQQAIATNNPKKVYSHTMKSMLSRQMNLTALFDKSLIKRSRGMDTSNDPDTSMSLDMSDSELAAVKRRIPKPPKLLFKKVDLTTITYQETNDNGTVGVAISGIPDAGRGLFNLSDHIWPAFSVVCIFGVRRITKEEHHDGLNKVARCGELGETFVVVNGVIREVEKFQMQYGHRLQPFDGLVDADGSVGGFPNDRVYEYPADIYWDASSFYNNCILVPGCIIDPQDEMSPIVLNQLYIVTWKEVAIREEFFLAYGTSYYEDDDKVKPKVRGAT